MHLDLNLLAALDALLEEGSVAGAADRLRLSPPAMSRTLGRIRRSTGDQILVRTGRTMTPTPYALAVREQVHRLVAEARGVLSPAASLDLGTLTRTFTIRCHDALATALAVPLLAAVGAQAPGVRLSLPAEGPGDTHDLRHGHVDLEIGATEPALPEIRGEVVAHDSWAVAGRDLPPVLTVDAYAAAGHVLVSRRGRLRDPVDDALAARGLRRTVVASLPSVAPALEVARRTDLLVTLPRHAAGAGELELRPLPLALPPNRVIMAWHQRYDDDRAHAWLRDTVREALAAVFTQHASPAVSGGSQGDPGSADRNA
ncbi:LysR family transcriptional regulator [Actinoplanes sp. NPDC049548]|uniref:LysR family transcriptional regulator n=1 Tax=Actinoplanes sp. NPDC049548 TaxID=3155152 RepID=UPI00343C3E7A